MRSVRWLWGQGCHTGACAIEGVVGASVVGVRHEDEGSLVSLGERCCGCVLHGG